VNGLYDRQGMDKPSSVNGGGCSNDYTEVYRSSSVGITLGNKESGLEKMELRLSLTKHMIAIRDTTTTRTRWV
jgi:hypothetical protein